MKRAASEAGSRFGLEEECIDSDDDDRWILFVNGRWPLTLSVQTKRGALAISPAIVVLYSLL